METSRLSKTLKKGGEPGLGRSKGVSGAAGSPDELGFGVDVPHAVLGQGLVHAVEERTQEPAQHPHQDEEGQVQGAPQVAALVSVWTLRSKDTFRPSASPAEGLRGGGGVSP